MYPTPGGRANEQFPVNAYEAESRRMARFSGTGHTPGLMAVPSEERNPEFPVHTGFTPGAMTKRCGAANLVRTTAFQAASSSLELDEYFRRHSRCSVRGDLQPRAGDLRRDAVRSGRVSATLGRLCRFDFRPGGAEELAHRWKTARQRIRENGVTYNVYGDPLGMDRPWNLDAIPLLISATEWRGDRSRPHPAGSACSTRYSPTSTARKSCCAGVIFPLPSYFFANPGFLRPCHSLPVPDNAWLHLLAVDLARSEDGQWWVVSDRTESPSGAGYALENRIVQAETFPDLFREFQVQRLASFFRAFRSNMMRLSTSMRNNPRVVLLTPGPLNETYFEHSYLARYLRIHTGAGRRSDGARQRAFSLKTLEGLKQVDVILRRVDGNFVRSHRAAFRFIPRRRRTGGSGARGKCGRRQCAGLGSD